MKTAEKSKRDYPGVRVELAEGDRVKVGQFTVVVARTGANGGKVSLAIDGPKDQPIIYNLPKDT